MAWADLLSDLAALGGIPGAARSYVRSQLVQAGVTAGQSANSILQAMSGLGVGVRRAQALTLIREEQVRQQAAGGAPALDLTSPVDQLLGTIPPANWTGQYVHQVTITYREQTEEGAYLLHTRTFGIKSPTALTGEEAVSATNDIIAQSFQEGDQRYPISPDSILTSGLTGAWYDTQNRSIPNVGGGAGVT